MTWVFDKMTAKNGEGDEIHYESIKVKHGKVGLYVETYVRVATLRVENIDMQMSHDDIVEEIRRRTEEG